MGFFQVRLQGDQICVPSEDRDRPVTGFFTTRFVAAASEKLAAEKAKSMVLKDWTTGHYSALNLNHGNGPRLAVLKISRASLFTWLLAKNTGHSFYAPENEEL